MPIEFPCSSCSSALKVPDEFAGKTAKCPKCSNLNAIPNEHDRASLEFPAASIVRPATNADKNPYASAQVSAAGLTNRHRGPLILKSIDVGSAAWMFGGFYALIGLFIGFAWGMLIVLGFAVSGNNGGPQAIGIGIGMLIGAVVFAPIVYGLFGMIGGMIAALTYNIVAKFCGGLRFETS